APAVMSRVYSASSNRLGWYGVPSAATTDARAGSDREFWGNQLVVAGGKTPRGFAPDLGTQYADDFTCESRRAPNPRWQFCATGTSVGCGPTSEWEPALYAGEQQHT